MKQMSFKSTFLLLHVGVKIENMRYLELKNIIVEIITYTITTHAIIYTQTIQLQ